MLGTKRPSLVSVSRFDTFCRRSVVSVDNQYGAVSDADELDMRMHEGLV